MTQPASQPVDQLLADIAARERAASRRAMLFTIIPIAVARQSGPNGSFPATGSRIVRHLRARRAKIAVAQKIAAVNSSGSACESRCATSVGDIPWSVQ